MAESSLYGCCAVFLAALCTQSKRALAENLAQNKGELRLRMDNIRNTDSSLAVHSLTEPERWSVQLFRSIDSGRKADQLGRSCILMQMLSKCSKVVIGPVVLQGKLCLGDDSCGVSGLSS